MDANQTGGSSDGSSTSGDGSGSGGADKAEILKNPRNYVLGVIVGAIFGLVEALFGAYITAGQQARMALTDAGSAIRNGFDDTGSALLDALGVPFEVLATLAASTGPAAPFVVAIGWFVSGAVVAGILWGIWRVLRWL